MSTPAKKIRGIKAFNVDKPEVVEHGNMKSQPRKFLEFWRSTATPDEVADAVTWRKICKGKLSKDDRGRASFQECMEAMNENIALTGTEFVSPSTR